MRKPNKSSKKSYKGPFQKNPELDLHNVKKTMRTETDGPTVDGFSDMDSTTTVNTKEESTTKTRSRTRRPTREKAKHNYFTGENVFLTILTIAAGWVGIIVFTHSNKFVSVEKDIEHVNEKLKDQNEALKDNNNKIDESNEKINKIDNKIDLLNQKVDMKLQKK